MSCQIHKSNFACRIKIRDYQVCCLNQPISAAGTECAMDLMILRRNCKTSAESCSLLAKESTAARWDGGEHMGAHAEWFQMVCVAAVLIRTRCAKHVTEIENRRCLRKQLIAVDAEIWFRGDNVGRNELC